MTTDEAIAILGDSCWDYIPEDETDIRDAIKLGIEALKRIQLQEDTDPQMMRIPLPGETKD